MGKSHKRIFIGTPLTSEYLDVCIGVKNINDKSGLRWVPQEQLHVTSLFIGDVSVEKIPEFISKIESLVLGFKPITLECEKFTFMPAARPKMLWLRFVKNREFARMNLLLSHKLLDKDPEYPAHAHTTLVRFNKAPRSHFRYLPLPKNNFVIDKLILFESILTPKGAEYYIIDEFELK